MLDQLFDPSNPTLWILLISVIASAIIIMSRPFATFVKFAYPNAKFEAMGNPYLKGSALKKLMEAPNLSGFVEQLNSDKDYNVSGETAKEIQQQLDQQFLQSIEMMKQDSSKKMKGFYDAFIEYHDVPFITIALLQKKRKEPIEESLIQQTISPMGKQMITHLSDEKLEDVAMLLKDIEVPDTDIEIILAADTPMILIDALIERVFLKRLLSLKLPGKSTQGVHRYLKRMIDIQHVKRLLRAKHLGYTPSLCMDLFLFDGYEIPQWKFNELCQQSTIEEIVKQLDGTSYYSTLLQIKDKRTTHASVQSFTNALDTIFLQLINALCLEFYVTIGPTLRFLTAKQYEIMNLKIITKGIADHLPQDLIMSLLIKEEGS